VLCTPTLLHSPLSMLRLRLAWWTDEAGVARAELPALLARSPQLLRLGSPNPIRPSPSPNPEPSLYADPNPNPDPNPDPNPNPNPNPDPDPDHTNPNPAPTPAPTPAPGPKQCEAMVAWLLTLKLSRAEACPA